MAMIAMMPAEHRGFASAVNHVTFGFGNVLGIALSSLLMSVAFEHHTGIAGTALTTANPSGFVAALNTTFIIAAGWSSVGVATSLYRQRANIVASWAALIMDDSRLLCGNDLDHDRLGVGAPAPRQQNAAETTCDYQQ